MSRKDLQCLGSQRPSLSANPLLIAVRESVPRKNDITCFLSVSLSLSLPSLSLASPGKDASLYLRLISLMA